MSTEGSKRGWTRLRAGGHEASGLEIPTLDTGVNTGFGTVRWALDGDGRPRLLLPIRASDHVASIGDSVAVTVATASYDLAGTPVRYLDLTCVIASLEGVFAEVGDEIINRISGGNSAVEACASTINDFRSLLARPEDEIESQRITGLLGELLILRRLLLIDPQAWQKWFGPESDRHDFHAGVLSLEVKTSSRVGNRIVRISAIDQLLEPSGGELVLVLCALEVTKGGALSVGEVASEVAALASDHMAVRDMLARMGCMDPESDAWNRLRYRQEGESAWSVRDGFPRLVPSSLAGGALPAGVGEVRYALDLGAADAFLMSDEELQIYLERIVAWS